MSIIIAMTVIAAGCGESKVDSHLDFATFVSPSSAGLAHAREASFKICIEGSQNEIAKAQDYARRAMLTWLRALRQIDPKVTSRVEFSCSAPHQTIKLIPGSGTSTSGAQHSNIYTERPYGTYLHEFGHSFAALGDTYDGGGGSCTAGQPESLMCRGAYGNKDSQGFSTLYQDDVTGIQSRYRQIFSDVTAPDPSINPLGPLNPDAPWSNATGSPLPGGATSVDGLFVLVSNVTNTAMPTLFISAPLTIESVFVCRGNQQNDACLRTAGAGVQARFNNVFQNRRYFSIDGLVGHPDFLTSTFFGVANGLAPATPMKKAVTFRRK